MNKNVTIIIVIVIIILVGLIMWLRSPQLSETGDAPIPTGELSEEDTTSAIIQDLEGLDIDDLDAEFQQIDADLEQL